MATKTAPEVLRRKERVIAATDLRGVPEGTSGRVILSNGFSWVRYWVAFDNGVEMGSIHRDKLVRAKEWDQYLVDRERRGAVAESTATVGDDGPAESEGAQGGGAEVNGVMVPQLLIDRTKSALERFGVAR